MKRLTESAQADRDDFDSAYGNRSCECHLGNPPCGYCTHPGNPLGQEGDEFYTFSQPKENRSTIDSTSLQEHLDAGVSAGQVLFAGANQYLSPAPLAQFLARLLPRTNPYVAFDPQCGDGKLLEHFAPSTVRFGMEIDNRLAENDDDIHRVTGNCVKVMEICTDLFPEMKFDCIVANPPFGNRWVTERGNMDSTEYTWRIVLSRLADNGFGFFIANHKTIEALKIHEHPWVYLYQKFPAGVWDNVAVEIGVVHFYNSNDRMTKQVIQWNDLELMGIVKGAGLNEWMPRVTELFYNCQNHHRYLPYPVSRIRVDTMVTAFSKMQDILDEEKKSRPPFNIFLDKREFLETYLSTRFTTKNKIGNDKIARLALINGCHPLTLTVDKKSRRLLAEVVADGFYTLQPEAKASIDAALKEVGQLACPIMQITSFEHTAYADEEDMLLCVKDWKGFRAGKKYNIETDSYKFVEKFTRKKPHYDEQNNRMYIKDHECQLAGTDRLIRIVDDRGWGHQFMDRPNEKFGYQHKESLLWEIFQKPTVLTVAEQNPAAVERNRRNLGILETMGGFTYYPGQKEYLARVGVKDYGLIGAETGTGKSLMAISLIQMKGAVRALIIAPQGTMRTSEDCDDDDATEFQASQWVTEIRTFAAGRPVFELFSFQDYQRILDANDGALPSGIFISYPQAMFLNGARERVPDTWDDLRLAIECQRVMGVPSLKLEEPPQEEKGNDRWHCEKIGEERNGIRCIIAPCLATLCGMEFDFIALDESHLIANLESNCSQMLIRMQPRYRYAFSATPIPNLVTNLFTTMGWLCVPGWYKGGVRSAAWPYAREDLSKFSSTFLSSERDFTQENMNHEAAQAAGKIYRGKCERVSPVIASPARLLKIIKPTLAYISKQDCKPDLPAPIITDIRVPLGKQQMKLYAHFLNRGNIPANNPLVRARKQTAWLRGICADPAGFKHGGPKVHSNMNPKTIAVMELVRDIVNKRQNVVLINSRVGITDTYQRLLEDAGCSIARIDSTISADQHSRQANMFKAGDANVMLMGIKCAASHSFSDCPNEIVSSIEFSPGPLTQAYGRIYRVNSRVTPVHVWVVLNEATIDDIMWSTVATKDDAATICLHGKRLERSFKPVDMSEVLADSILAFKDADMSNCPSEELLENKWPAIRKGFNV